MKSKFLEEENGRTKKGVVTQRHGRPTRCTNHLRSGFRASVSAAQCVKPLGAASAALPRPPDAVPLARAHTRTHTRASCCRFPRTLGRPSRTRPVAGHGSSGAGSGSQNTRSRPVSKKRRSQGRRQSPPPSPRAPRGEAAARSWARPAKAWGGHVPQSSSGETRRCLLCLETHGKEFKTVSPSRRPGNGTPLLSPAQPLLPERGNGPRGVWGNT